MDHQEMVMDLQVEMEIQVETLAEIPQEKEIVVQEDQTMDLDTEDQEDQETVAQEDQMMEQDMEGQVL
jgi:hypothetical protein